MASKLDEGGQLAHTPSMGVVIMRGGGGGGTRPVARASAAVGRRY